MKNTVVIKKCKEYKVPDIQARIEEGLELLGGLDKFVKKGESVLLKVNCLFPSEPEKAVITHPEFVRAVVRIVKRNASKVMIGDSPGFGNFTGSKKTGYREVAMQEGAELVEFKEEGEAGSNRALVYRNFKIAGAVAAADRIINLPKLKTHGLMYMTMCVKNMFGIIVGAGKPAYHMRAGRDKMLFARMLVDLFTAKTPDLNIVDGIVAMQGNGPGGGEPAYTGVIVMGEDGFAVDHVIPQIVGLNPDRVYTNAVYRREVLGGAAPDVEIAGENIADVAYKGFKPVPGEKDTPDSKLNTGVTFGTLYRFGRDLITPKQVYLKKLCTGCRSCVKVCPVSALVYDEKKKRIICDYNKCIRCFICQEICPEKAIVIKKPLLGKILG
ncbi:MAG: DUF362 domain-containing protein [Spirochaetia bacterium]|nr:DUF362 domain-containing protein [Spirochaetia bacterium]